MSNRIVYPAVEKVSHLRDEILQQFFLLQITRGGADWKQKVADQIFIHPANSKEGKAYRKFRNKIRRFGKESLEITDFDTTAISALILYEFPSEFQIGNYLISYVEDVREVRNNKNHGANPKNVLHTRAEAAHALETLIQFLKYLEKTWGHSKKDDFIREYLNKLKDVEAELFNDSSSEQHDYRAYSFEELQELADDDIPEAKLEMGIRLYDHALEDVDYATDKAIDLFEAAADADIPEAKARLARSIFVKKETTKEEIRKAYSLLAEAERKGCSYAHFVYGMIAFDGLGDEEKNIKKAYQEFVKGAEKGCVEAKMFKVYCEATENETTKISLAYLTKIESLANEIDNGYAYNFAGYCYAKSEKNEDAVKLFEKATKKGYGYSYYNLGHAYRLGRGVKKDPFKAFDLYEKAADKGHLAAKYELALGYYFGNVVQQDYDKAFNMFHDLLKDGYNPVKPMLAECFYYGRGTCENKGNAFKLAKIAAEQDNTGIAEYRVGVMYYKGEGVEKNPTLAFEYYKKAADKGYTIAEYRVGVMYYKGEGVEKNPTLAFEYYKKAADKGYTSAEFSVGVMYYKGEGVEKTPTLAFEYYKKAADKGHTSAECRVGVMYEEGIGVDKTPTLAFEYLKKAADKGNESAQYCLAECYIKGNGTERNPSLAFTLFEKVGLSNHRFSKSAREQLCRMSSYIKFHNKVEETCLKHKWFDELTEEYFSKISYENMLFDYFNQYNKHIDRTISWLDKAQEAGYSKALEKKGDPRLSMRL